MDQQQAQMMQNYPDPTAVATEVNGPFYAPNPAGQQQQQQPQQLQHQPQQEPQQQHQQQLQHQQQDPEQEQRHANPELQIAQHAIQFSAQPNMQPNIDLKSMLDIHAGDPRLGDESHQQQQQMSADMGHGQNQSQYGPADGTTPRKRSKVSRACDECRRKKIRCDATTESGQEQCTSCKRVGTHCQFSRIPMKRGPSKGYIKELADRLNRLEGDMHNQAAGDQIHYPPPPNADMGMSRRASQDFSPPPQIDGQPGTGRKRTHSSISQEFGAPGFGPHVSQRQSGQWSQFETPRHAPSQPFAQGPADPYRPIPSYSPNGLAPQAQFPNARDARAFTDNNNLEQLDIQNIDLDENVYDRYFETIHKTFPILPWKESLFQRLKNCAPVVASALNASLYAVMSTLTGNHNPDEARRANNFITQCMQDDFAQARMFNGGRLILLAAVTLMAVEAGHRSNSVGSQSAYLGQGIALAQDLRLHAYQQGTHSEDDSDEQLGRRLWWSLVLIDRFRASGQAVPLMIPEPSVVLYTEDVQNLGTQTYDLARISLALAHLTNFLSIPTPANSKALVLLSRGYAGVVNSLLEEIRLSLPVDHHSSQNPLTYLAFWHTRILLRRLQDTADPAETFDDAHHILSLAPAVFSPLCKDVTILATVSLMELLDHENAKIKSDAELELKQYISSAPRFTTSDSWEVQLRDLVLKHIANIGSASQNQGQAGAAQGQQGTSSAALTASQGLQHLADLATAGDTARQEQENAGNGNCNAQSSVAWDKKELTRGGFLSVLARPAAAPRTQFM